MELKKRGGLMAPPTINSQSIAPPTITSQLIAVTSCCSLVEKGEKRDKEKEAGMELEKRGGLMALLAGIVEILLCQEKMEKETALSDVHRLKNKITKTKEVVEELQSLLKDSWKECCIGQSDSLKAQQDHAVSERALLSREKQLHCQMAANDKKTSADLQANDRRGHLQMARIVLENDVKLGASNWHHHLELLKMINDTTAKFKGVVKKNEDEVAKLIEDTTAKFKGVVKKNEDKVAKLIEEKDNEIKVSSHQINL